MDGRQVRPYRSDRQSGTADVFSFLPIREDGGLVDGGCNARAAPIPETNQADGRISLAVKTKLTGPEQSEIITQHGDGQITTYKTIWRWLKPSATSLFRNCILAHRRCRKALPPKSLCPFRKAIYFLPTRIRGSKAE
jgi:hypothetical protein